MWTLDETEATERESNTIEQTAHPDGRGATFVARCVLLPVCLIAPWYAFLYTDPVLISLVALSAIALWACVGPRPTRLGPALLLALVTTANLFWIVGFLILALSHWHYC